MPWIPMCKKNAMLVDFGLSPICFRASGYYSSGIQKAAMGFIKFIGLWVKGPKIRIRSQSPPDLILVNLSIHTRMMELDIR